MIRKPCCVDHKKFMKIKTKQSVQAYLFMAPALIMIFVFVIAPILGSLPLMFYNYSVLGETKFIGLDNFKRAFGDPEFRIAMLNSVLFVAVVPVLQLLSILLALLVNQKLKGVAVFRTLIYIPVITSMVAVSIIWGFLFDPSGAINTALQDAGLIRTPLGFLSSEKTAMLCIMFITIWQGIGYYMMMYLAGLQSVPKELQEAAIVDGANSLQCFVKVTLPMLKPYIWFCTLNSLISAVGIFDIVFVLTKGGPYHATLVINYYSYIKAFSDFEFGYSAAIGAVQAVITSLISIFVFAYGKKGGGMNYND